MPSRRSGELVLYRSNHEHGEERGHQYPEDRRFGRSEELVRYRPNHDREERGHHYEEDRRPGRYQDSPLGYSSGNIRDYDEYPINTRSHRGSRRRSRSGRSSGFTRLYIVKDPQYEPRSSRRRSRRYGWNDWPDVIMG